MRHAVTSRLATQAAAAAKAKARAEAEEIAREVSRRKKAEHDAKVAEAAMEDIKKTAARKKLEVLAAIEEEANAELLRYEKQLQAATWIVAVGYKCLQDLEDLCYVGQRACYIKYVHIASLIS